MMELGQFLNFQNQINSNTLVKAFTKSLNLR